MSFIPLNDALIKVMSQRLPLAEIVAMRAVISLAILVVFTNGLRSILALDSRTILLFVLRGMCLVAAMYLYFLALSSLPNWFPSYRCCRVGFIGRCTDYETRDKLF
jgi:drug/metabolite transporter (DMT)-like permease